ncbi:MAG TPA: methionine adenosyltransferase [Bacteroidales bacterium]|nr:methionine adenosyltransferase [Bacteroidales bacterium]HPR56889.1 methionine adenosyltransferase [Bacteroidales bacterium]HRW96067.1 methionine adenosyltransferase [Bacteroidales bacterium]
MSYLFTSESVSEGHPDKVADQISDALLDEFLRHDPDSKVACETLVTTGLVVVSGEVRTTGYVDVQDIVRHQINTIGYTKPSYRFEGNSCGVISTIHEQSDDINQGVSRQRVEDQGAGDQGMMFGYAVREMDNLMPLPIELAHILLQQLAAIRKEGKVMTYLGPDSKSQVTIEYDDNNEPVRIDTIVVSTLHDDFGSDKAMQEKITADIKMYLIPRAIEESPAKYRHLFKDDFTLLVNPTGKFVTGGPHGDTGLTGRKIIVDTYGGKVAHGGGAFSGKDASKVDRSAAYAARHIAKNLVAAGVADEVLVQVAYAIGVSKPVGLYINTFGTAKVNADKGIRMKDSQISKIVGQIYDLTPYAIIRRFGLKNPIFLRTTTYGHFGRDHYTEEVEVYYEDETTYRKKINGLEKIFKTVEFFAWEKLDYVEKFKSAFHL